MYISIFIEGPFNIVLGHSQGGALAIYLCVLSALKSKDSISSLLADNLAKGNVDHNNQSPFYDGLNIPNPDLAIILSSFAPR
jgi:predicted esterase